jgi:hypothetical protein
MAFLCEVTPVFAISPELEALVEYETQYNQGYFIRLNLNPQTKERFSVEHLEIPLDMVSMDIAKTGANHFFESLTFTKGKKRYLRWIIHPEDQSYINEVEDWLNANNLPVKRKKYFWGYKTASRSLILVDPQSNIEFSLKTSTDHLHGHPIGKGQPWDDSQQIRQISDLIKDHSDKQPPKRVLYLDEPLAFGIPEVKMGMVVRSYDQLGGSGLRYVPGFAIMHGELGAEIAKVNGAKSPGAFWNEHYNKALARALAELFIISGTLPIAGHSQNFLVELDQNLRPTGRIAVRDIGDSVIWPAYFNALGRDDVPKSWSKNFWMKKSAFLTVGLIAMTANPGWLKRIDKRPGDPNYYHTWGQDFFDAFDDEFHKQTGLRMTRNAEPMKRQEDLFRIGYKLNTPDMKTFLDRISNGNFRKLGKEGDCSRLLYK